MQTNPSQHLLLAPSPDCSYALGDNIPLFSSLHQVLDSQRQPLCPEPTELFNRPFLTCSPAGHGFLRKPRKALACAFPSLPPAVWQPGCFPGGLCGGPCLPCPGNCEPNGFLPAVISILHVLPRLMKTSPRYALKGGCIQPEGQCEAELS